METVVISGKKTWLHGSNPEAEHPGKITVYVINGRYVAAKKSVTADDGWRWSFELPKYDNDGREITYAVDEADVACYAKRVDGYNIINTYNPDEPPPSPGKPGAAPNTGDENNVWLWASLMVVSGAALQIIMFADRRKRRKGGEHGNV
ncbi:MAG: Cna B-type domain-containing protein [Oscillospiraceae bacterium]|nr:Cna B-type domain-containing protein [Oscillospiraceae bacterium]